MPGQKVIDATGLVSELIEKVKNWPWLRIFTGTGRILLPSIIAFPIVLLLREKNLISSQDALYTAWVATSINLGAWFNAFYREQKRFEDIDNHERNYNAVDEVLKLLRTVRSELALHKDNTEVGMPPVNPPAPQASNPISQNPTSALPGGSNP